MRERRWISPQIIDHQPRGQLRGYDEVKELGRKVIEVLGIETSATHMEWFFGPKGLKFSEIGCRPPGVDAWDVYCAANEIDLYRRLGPSHPGPTSGTSAPSRRFAAGHIALRPDRDGTIAGYEGHGRASPSPRSSGSSPRTSRPKAPPPQPVEAGFKANAWVRTAPSGLRRR